MIYHDCNNFFDTKMITKVSLVIFIVKKKTENSKNCPRVKKMSYFALSNNS